MFVLVQMVALSVPEVCPGSDDDADVADVCSGPDGGAVVPEVCTGPDGDAVVADVSPVPDVGSDDLFLSRWWRCCSRGLYWS